MGHKSSSDGELEVLDHTHEKIHKGMFYRLCAINADLDTADELILAFKTPDTDTEIHIVPKLTVTTAGLWAILEGPTITAGTGTVVPAINRNRRSSNVSSIRDMQATPVVGQSTKDPTITVDGGTICSFLVGNGSASPFKQGGANREEEEWVLKRNTVYAFRLTGQSDDNRVSIALNFYEE